ncbi:putative monovalent cation/H+ antiporter subunit B [Thiorhodovibrio winogradskyi]|uniref:Monovalent cation/H+ antiporter subunit B n=1 Tax=Thiorhodovibrio winogradskyi TaxID=77007 RepID=A0ABZ0S5W6_9GAMM|nr:DUF4040 domain-containing protein [Thiorhodovibrio winogradskyi]
MTDNPAMFVFDILMISTLLGLAIATLSSRDPRRAAILFVAFGLWLSIVWARLGAPDVALAEAAIGAGLGGALMLAAARRTPGGRGPSESAAMESNPTGPSLDSPDHEPLPEPEPEHELERQPAHEPKTQSEQEPVAPDSPPESPSACEPTADQTGTRGASPAIQSRDPVSNPRRRPKSKSRSKFKRPGRSPSQ